MSKVVFPLPTLPITIMISPDATEKFNPLIEAFPLDHPKDRSLQSTPFWSRLSVGFFLYSRAKTEAYLVRIAEKFPIAFVDKNVNPFTVMNRV
jgi:hypothetical protein